MDPWFQRNRKLIRMNLLQLATIAIIRRALYATTSCEQFSPLEIPPKTHWKNMENKKMKEFYKPIEGQIDRSKEKIQINDSKLIEKKKLTSRFRVSQELVNI